MSLVYLFHLFLQNLRFTYRIIPVTFSFTHLFHSFIPNFPNIMCPFPIYYIPLSKIPSRHCHTQSFHLLPQNYTFFNIRHFFFTSFNYLSKTVLRPYTETSKFSFSFPYSSYLFTQNLMYHLNNIFSPHFPSHYQNFPNTIHRNITNIVTLT